MCIIFHMKTGLRGPQRYNRDMTLGRREWLRGVPAFGSLVLLSGRAAAEELVEVNGLYVFSGGARQEDRRKAAVEAVVAEVNFLIRGMARDRILEGTAPKTPLDVRLDVGSQRARLSAPQMPDIAGSIDGRPFPWKTKRGDRSTIAMTYADNALKVRFRGDGADSRYTYRFDPSGDSIRLGVFIRHRLMPSPLRFRLSYRRKGA